MQHNNLHYSSGWLLSNLIKTMHTENNIKNYMNVNTRVMFFRVGLWSLNTFLMSKSIEKLGSTSALVLTGDVSVM